MTEEEVAASSPRTEPVGACPVCGGAASEFFEEGDRLHGVPGRYGYARCRGCHTVFQDPRVREEDLGLLYPDRYHTHGPRGVVEPWSPPPRPGAGLRDRLRELVLRGAAPESGAGEPGLLPRLLARSPWLRERAFRDQVPAEMLPRRRPPGRALDVGCGGGRLLPRLAAVGWEVEGLEWDREAAREARRATGLPVHRGRAADLGSAGGPYDLMTLVHVFEHLPRPVEALGHMADRLTPGGRIVLIYPNPESLLARWMGSDWFGWEVPRHLVLPPPAALGLAAGRAGLSIHSVRTQARWGAALAWQSRALRSGELRDPDRILDPHPGIRDRAAGWLEGLLVALGRPVGEEVVAVLERGSG